MADLAKGIGMHLADEAGPDHGNVQFPFGHGHSLRGQQTAPHTL